MFDSISAAMRDTKKVSRRLLFGQSMQLDLALEEVLSPKDREALKGASNGGYHYFGSAKIFAQMGKAFAEALLPLQK